MEHPSQDAALQPLREIGCETKTRFWDIEEIQAAIRAANSRGICPESLFAQNRAGIPGTFHKAG